MKDRETQKYYKKIQHNVLRGKECLAAASSLLDPGHQNCRVWLIPKSESQVDRSFMTTAALGLALRTAFTESLSSDRSPP